MTWGIMLARLAFIMRAYKARVGPLETISIIPIRSFFMNLHGSVQAFTGIPQLRASRSPRGQIRATAPSLVQRFFDWADNLGRLLVDREQHAPLSRRARLSVATQASWV